MVCYPAVMWNPWIYSSPSVYLFKIVMFIVHIMCPSPMSLKMNKEGKMNRNTQWKLSQVETTVIVVTEIDTVLVSIVSVLWSIPGWSMKESLTEGGECTDYTSVS